MLKLFKQMDYWKNVQGVEGFHAAIEKLGTTWNQLNEDRQGYDAPDSIWGQLAQMTEMKNKNTLNEMVKKYSRLFLVTKHSLNFLSIQTQLPIIWNHPKYRSVIIFEFDHHTLSTYGNEILAFRVTNGLK